ncbi:helix-turn-helix domain-containing protein [Bacteroides nordii]|uniref:helix-turn-helix domain-containing protein n=1 Tax=Bacteroides nordii TaxID=291645 RepID=UPI003522D719
MSVKKTKSSILDRIKEAYRLKNNAELARFLGVKPNTISNWYARNSIDYDIIFSKCDDLDLTWLINGIDKNGVSSEVIPVDDLSMEEKETFKDIAKDERTIRAIISSNGSITLLNRLVQHTKNEYVYENYQSIEGNIDLINTWLKHYSIVTKFMDTYDSFIDNKISYEELLQVFKKDYKIEVELFDILFSYKDVISEICNKVSDFNDLHDRLFSVDDAYFDEIDDATKK